MQGGLHLINTDLSLQVSFYSKSIIVIFFAILIKIILSCKDEDKNNRLIIFVLNI